MVHPKDDTNTTSPRTNGTANISTSDLDNMSLQQLLGHAVRQQADSGEPNPFLLPNPRPAAVLHEEQAPQPQMPHQSTRALLLETIGDAIMVASSVTPEGASGRRSSGPRRTDQDDSEAAQNQGSDEESRQ